MKTGNIAPLPLVSVMVLLLLEPVPADSNSEDPQDSRIRRVLISAGNTASISTIGSGRKLTNRKSPLHPEEPFKPYLKKRENRREQNEKEF